MLQIVGSVPEVVANLQRQDTKAATYLLDSLVELIDCLMFQHPGFPELYETTVDALKVRKLALCKLVSRLSVCTAVSACTVVEVLC